MRSYDDPCGVARALDLVGERWTLLVVRELLFGAKRFSDLVRGLPGMSQNVLSQRLRDLGEAGLVRARKLGPPVSTRVYELTERGAALEPVLIELGRWGSRTALRPGPELSVDALMLALKTTYVPGPDFDCELRFDGDVFGVSAMDGQLTIGRGSPERPEVVAELDAKTLRGLVFGARKIRAAERAGELRLTGDRAAFERFAGCFPRPEPL
ncbi:winged helix-turn-helix transcriptional regulator [Amycolatopsis pithecellobii]|uniref:Transcriptional regulator n=1 Tax=Amycolatopsis pithecellobii TaxID=664692 RepID=A0A6N7Z7V4_9PSEU|nr:winged helix-turn-helix transcriptional regulator [Amycolatopsis pithecellobii]MTD57464.1 transcriptional regulator [Amycolatopsis pithecellobii]